MRRGGFIRRGKGLKRGAFRRKARPREPRTQADGLAIPKPGVRIRDEAVLDLARNLGYCEYAGCTYRGRCHPCHIKTRGSGGHDTRDNIVAGCWHHHRLQEDGHISKEVMRRIVEARPRSHPLYAGARREGESWEPRPDRS